MEYWKPISGYEDVYSVSNAGRVRRETAVTCAKAGSILRTPLRNSYPCVDLSRNGKATIFSVHRLVADAFIGPCPQGMVVNHKDADRTNNNVSNLEYVTQSENCLHAYKVGRRDAKGSLNGQAKLTEQQVAEIKATPIIRGTMASLARQYGVSCTTIRQIINGQVWSHVLPRRAA